MIVFLYTVGALACIWVGTREQRYKGKIKFPAILWFTLAFLLVLLGLNREAGFLNGITDYFRMQAKIGGWYAQRRELQSPLVRIIPAAAIAVFALIAFLIRRTLKQNALVLSTIFYLVTYAAIEGVSLHNVDRFLGLHVLGSSVKTWLDFVGFLLAMTAVTTYVREVIRPMLPSLNRMR